MCIVTARLRGDQAPEERHVSRSQRPVGIPPPIESCRSYGAWLNSGGELPIDMALLWSFPPWPPQRDEKAIGPNE